MTNKHTPENIKLREMYCALSSEALNRLSHALVIYWRSPVCKEF